MKKSLKFLSLSLVLVLMISVLSGCGLKKPEGQGSTTPSTSNGADNGGSTPEVTLVYAEVNPLDSIVGQVASFYKEKVEELSGGSIRIDIQHSGVLGSENDVLDTMLGGGGTIDMARISAFALTPYGGQKSKLLSLPFIFESRDHYWNFATSDLAPEFLLEPYENGSGVRGLFFGEEGFRHFFTVDPISGMEDLKGMKLRVSTDPIMTGMVESLGAAPTVVSFGELYSALQTGVVDGAEQPIVNYKANAFQEVAPYLILDGHTLGATQVIITDEAWDRLTEEQQNVLIEAGKLAAEYNRQISEEIENEVLEELKAEGVTIIEVEDLTPWQEAVEHIIDAETKGLEDLYQQIVDMK